MDCDRCLTLIDDAIDGALDSATASELTAHCAGCATCDAELAATRALVAAARALPRDMPREQTPPEHLWRAIAQRTVARAAPRVRWPAFAAAASVIVVIGGMLATRYGATLPAPTTAFVERPRGVAVFAIANPGMERRAHLVAAVTGEGKHMDAATRATVEHNLALIQAALSAIDAAVQANPNDQNLRQLLTSIHIQESALIERMQRLSIESSRRNDI